mmetsp:Transcript_1857/g.1653  ORF Transcript_1857/g.1653 Transcript_1857/m.1653 type:complete len:136 (-) Transcript_1857:62-469(-)
MMLSASWEEDQDDADSQFTKKINESINTEEPRRPKVEESKSNNRIIEDNKNMPVSIYCKNATLIQYNGKVNVNNLPGEGRVKGGKSVSSISKDSKRKNRPHIINDEKLKFSDIQEMTKYNNRFRTKKGINNDYKC